MIYDDSEMRVLNVYLQPAASGQAYQHEYPAIFYEDMPSDHLVIDEIKNEATTRQEIWPKPGFEYEGLEISHIVTNLEDERPYFGFRLEVKKINLPGMHPFNWKSNVLFNPSKINLIW